MDLLSQNAHPDNTDEKPDLSPANRRNSISMSHDPNQRFLSTRCEKCGHRAELTHVENLDEYWCDSCIDNEAEAAYDRQQEANLESPPESSREAQLRTWEEHQKAHKR